MLLAIYLKHNSEENSSLFYVASDLRNNLEHANLTQDTYFAIPRPQINES